MSRQAQREAWSICHCEYFLLLLSTLILPCLLSSTQKEFSPKFGIVQLLVQCITWKYPAVQCSAVQCTAVQCSEVQCSAVQCSVLHTGAVGSQYGEEEPPGSPPPREESVSCTLQCCPAHHCTSLHSTAHHCTPLHTTAHHCTPHHCTSLHCTPLDCSTLHCAILNFGKQP